MFVVVHDERVYDQVPGRRSRRLHARAAVPACSTCRLQMLYGQSAGQPASGLRFAIPWRQLESPAAKPALRGRSPSTWKVQRRNLPEPLHTQALPRQCCALRSAPRLRSPRVQAPIRLQRRPAPMLEVSRRSTLAGPHDRQGGPCPRSCSR